MIYASTACLYPTQPLNQRIEIYTKHEIENIELGAAVSVSEDYLELLENYNINWLVHNYFPPAKNSFVLNLASKNPLIQKQSIDFIAQSMSLSAHLGAPFYSIHAGFITDPIGMGTYSFIFPEPDSDEEELLAFQRFVDAIKILVTQAKPLNIKLLIENNVCTPDLKGKMLLQSTEEFLRLFEHFHSPFLGILLDTGHLNVSADTLGFDKHEFIEAHESNIHALHVHENDGKSDLHHPIQPKGWVLNLLKQPSFRDRAIIIESKFDHVQDLKQHINYLHEELA